jgi:hypothetical protein
MSGRHIQLAAVILGLLLLPLTVLADDASPTVTSDPYIALFGGITSPTKTEAHVDNPSNNSHFTVLDQGFSPSKSIGGKIGIWFTNLRKRTAPDFGLELDITNYQPDIKTGPYKATGISRGAPTSSITWTNKIDVDATLIALNLLGRIPYISQVNFHKAVCTLMEEAG